MQCAYLQVLCLKSRKCSISLSLIKTLGTHRTVLAVWSIIYWDNNSSPTNFCGKWQHRHLSTTPSRKTYGSKVKKSQQERTEHTHVPSGRQTPSWGSPSASKVKESQFIKSSVQRNCSSHPILDHLGPHCGSPTLQSSWSSWGYFWNFWAWSCPSRALQILPGPCSHTYFFRCLVFSQIIYKAIYDFYIHPVSSSWWGHSAPRELRALRSQAFLLCQRTHAFFKA